MKHWACAIVALTAAGCVVDAPPRPRQPANVHPAKLVPAAVSEFQDTDDNRYRDSSPVVVYVMGDSPGYHLPLKIEGEFVLRLESPGGQLVAEWKFDRAATAAAMRVLNPGPGFVFELDLRKSATTGNTDVVKQAEADLVVVFTSAAGETIRARTSAPILIGATDRGLR